MSGNGNLLITHLGKNALPETDADKLSATYSIQNDKVVSAIGNAPFDMSFYRVGDTYYAARDNEFGYANYQIMANPSAHLSALRKEEANESQRARLQRAGLR
jgi:hypothetical protein